MTCQRMPKVLALWALFALLIPTPRAFSQMVQAEPQNRERPERECHDARPSRVAPERPVADTPLNSASHNARVPTQALWARANSSQRDVRRSLAPLTIDDPIASTAR